MVGTALTTQERKEIAKRLKLKTNPDELNEFVKNTHKEFRRKTIVEPRREAKKKKVESKKAEKKFKKAFGKLIEKPKEHKKSVIEKDNGKKCTTRELARVLDYLIEKKGQEVNLAEIMDFTCLNNGVINQGLKFLVRYKIIKEINKKGWYFYVYS